MSQNFYYGKETLTARIALSIAQGIPGACWRPT